VHDREVVGWEAREKLRRAAVTTEGDTFLTTRTNRFCNASAGSAACRAATVDGFGGAPRLLLPQAVSIGAITQSATASTRKRRSWSSRRRIIVSTT
jgi:hypothetical protein